MEEETYEILVGEPAEKFRSRQVEPASEVDAPNETELRRLGALVGKG